MPVRRTLARLLIRYLQKQARGSLRKVLAEYPELRAGAKAAGIRRLYARHRWFGRPEAYGEFFSGVSERDPMRRSIALYAPISPIDKLRNLLAGERHRWQPQRTIAHELGHRLQQIANVPYYEGLGMGAEALSSALLGETGGSPLTYKFLRRPEFRQILAAIRAARRAK